MNIFTASSLAPRSRPDINENPLAAQLECVRDEVAVPAAFASRLAHERGTASCLATVAIWMPAPSVVSAGAGNMHLRPLVSRPQEVLEGCIGDLTAVFDALCYGVAKVIAHVDARKPVFQRSLRETAERAVHR